MDAILDNLEGDDMTTAEKIAQCRAWLVDENRDHPNWRAVEMALKLLPLLEKIQEYETTFKSIAELAAQSIDIRNETDSSSHTGTGHHVATHERLTCPSITLPDSFWNHRSKFNFPEAINGEPEVNMNLYQLLQLIINALGLGEYLKPILDVPIMDTAADIMITTKLNKLLCGSMEGKKHPKTEAEKEKIFNSGTEVAGEAFEQLVLVRIQNRTYAVGLIASLQGFQLISTKSDFSGISLDATGAKSFCEAQRQRTQNSLTSDRHQIIADPATPGRPKKKTKVEITKAPTKNGRVSIAISSSETKREFYASDVLSFGNDEDKKTEKFSACLLRSYCFALSL